MAVDKLGLAQPQNCNQSKCPKPSCCKDPYCRVIYLYWFDYTTYTDLIMQLCMNRSPGTSEMQFVDNEPWTPSLLCCSCISDQYVHAYHVVSVEKGGATHELIKCNVRKKVMASSLAQSTHKYILHRQQKSLLSVKCNSWVHSKVSTQVRPVGRQAMHAMHLKCACKFNSACDDVAQYL